MDILRVTPLATADVPAAAALWRASCLRYSAGHGALPGIWREGAPQIADFIAGHAASGQALAAWEGERLAGYLCYDAFTFHGQVSAFCPIAGHAAGEDAAPVYAALYSQASRRWAGAGIRQHLWTVFYDDLLLRDRLYWLGFGAYVVDCFTPADALPYEDSAAVRPAGAEDLDVLFDLAEESRVYYGAPPLFLVREPMGREELAALLRSGVTLLALDAGEPAGFIHVSFTQSTSPIDLTAPGCGLIDEIGLFLRSASRGRGLGRALLCAALSACRDRGTPRVHVDYEAANPTAALFWPRYFRPALLSVRRVLMPDSAVWI